MHHVPYIWSHHHKFRSHWNTCKLPQFHGPILQFFPLPRIYSVAYRDVSSFKTTGPILCLLHRQILSYSPCRVWTPEQLKISSNSYPLLQTRHTSFNPLYPMRDYHILHEGNNVCLLNIHKVITCLYCFFNSAEIRNINNSLCHDSITSRNLAGSLLI